MELHFSQARLKTLAPFVFNDHEKLVNEFFSPPVDIDSDSLVL